MTALPGITIPWISSCSTPSIQNPQQFEWLDESNNGIVDKREEKTHLLFTIYGRFFFYFYSWTINGHVIIFTQQLNKICVSVSSSSISWVVVQISLLLLFNPSHSATLRCRTWIDWTRELPVFCCYSGIIYTKKYHREWIKRNYVIK